MATELLDPKKGVDLTDKPAAVGDTLLTTMSHLT